MQSMTYDRANRLLNSTSGNIITSFSFDNVFMGVEHTINSLTNYSYDGENRLVGVVYPDNTRSTYTYQGYNRLRRSAWEPGQSLTTFVWNGSDYLQERS